MVGGEFEEGPSRVVGVSPGIAVCLLLRVTLLYASNQYPPSHSHFRMRTDERRQGRLWERWMDGLEGWLEGIIHILQCDDAEHHDGVGCFATFRKFMRIKRGPHPRHTWQASIPTHASVHKIYTGGGEGGREEGGGRREGGRKLGMGTRADRWRCPPGGTRANFSSPDISLAPADTTGKLQSKKSKALSSPPL
jgi:hypothetical protein